MKILLTLYINFLIGVVGIYFSAKNKNTSEKKELWKKFFIYVLILHLIIYPCIFFKPAFEITAVIIIAIGLFEVVIITRNNNSLLLQSLFVFLPMALGFVLFSLKNVGTTIATVYSAALLFDGFSQISGHVFGKRKLVPSISPNKTVEGLLGGILVAFISYLFISDISIKQISYLSVLLVLAACLFGDLAASFLKRRADVKDFSNLIPHHGGVLDRFDSFITAGCMAFILQLFNFKF